MKSIKNADVLILKQVFKQNFKMYTKLIYLIFFSFALVFKGLGLENNKIIFFLYLAAPRQCIELHFDEKYSIEPSWECKFDHIEVRDGPFGFSPILGRFCGQQNPPMIKSSGRFLWIKFFADAELESIGFSARYNFTPGKYKPSHF